MPHIPAEILLSLGELLDGRSLVACLRVSQHWHNALRPFVWTTISKNHWISYKFPLRHWIPLEDHPRPHDQAQEQQNAKIIYGLQHTRSLTFYNNNAITIKETHIHILSQIPMLRLILVLERMPNLVSFSLVMSSHGPDDYSLSSILRLLHDIDSLQAVEIDLPYRSRQVAIKHHFTLFARLKELKIAGDWYRGAKTLAPEPIEYTPWKLQQFNIDRLDMSFYHYCPDLKELTFDVTGSQEYGGVGGSPTIIPKIVRQLQGLSRLNTIVLSMYWGWQKHVYTVAKDRDDEARWVLTPQGSGVNLRSPAVLTLQEIVTSL
ncbi:hypothetical protein BGZ96_001775 [Linnemannia gamsii]|uniref:F-box domain-containing protein n=1 Tax=Linnemannia gamsii TaxID=64522 RepID=A0ABQ7JLX9_9FUNG|nr:hypothetical protein BGZ96_001775 [Linnemannia gamsii]